MIWRDMEFIFGEMEEDMKVNTRMIRNMVTVFIIGQIIENMKVGG
jgi:hypothetical protein